MRFLRIVRTFKTTSIPPPYIPSNLRPKKEEPGIKFTETDKEQIRKAIQDLRDRVRMLEEANRHNNNI